VRYSGPFNPERIPGMREGIERRPDVAQYLAATGPKASAFHPAGILRVMTGASSQYDAEVQALSACNSDPTRSSSGGGPCYLYSVDNKVVLPQRAIAPITQPATPVRDLLVALLAKVAPGYPIAYRQVREYLESKPHKALAALPPSLSWRTGGGDTAAVAEQRVLEGCQMRHGGPCILLAVDDTIRMTGAAEDAQARPMVRLSYEGPFDPEQIPAILDDTRRRADIANYPAAPTNKAAAIHPWGRVFLAVGKSTQREAEESALQACNGDSDRNGKDGACLLYAVGDQVVLPKRLTKPLSPP
jgi:hypothetical protein